MNRRDPQSPEELELLLHAGMGRAILYLQNRDLSHYRELILDACIRSHVYDSQIEDSHANYLYPLIRASNEEDYYHREIARALLEAKESLDAEQLLDFAVIFASEGDERSREAIYEKVRRNDTDTALTGEEQIVELEGAKGLIFLLELIGQNSELLTWWHDDYSISDAEKSSSIEEVRLALREAAEENSDVAAALSNIRHYSVDWTASEIAQRRKERIASFRRPDAGLSEKTTWAELKNRPDFKSMVFRWPRLATDEEFEKAARDINPNAEPARLSSHLRLFGKRPFPMDPQPLIDLVQHIDDKVAIPALCALELVHHRKVRRLFEQLRTSSEWSYRAAGLLRANYQGGDERIISEMLDAENDPDNLHVMCIDAMHVYEDNPVPESAGPLLAVYEKDPCLSCRCKAVEIMEQMGVIPDWMVEECCWDAYSVTRELGARLRDSAH